MDRLFEEAPGLSEATLAFLEETARDYRLTLQDKRNLLIIAQDLSAWNETPVEELWEAPPEGVMGKNRKQWSLSRLEKRWKALKENPSDYSTPPDEQEGSAAPERSIPPKNPEDSEKSTASLTFQELPKEDSSTLLGTCPVSSEKTRCCKLQTLDAVIHCGFDCSYCTIQSFYKNNTIRFHGGLDQKLDALELDPEKIYHIGTGQSSDSLLWGNRNNLLDDLFAFARKNPNVILELKTKSGDVSYLEGNPIPPNILTTWSLNTPAIIAHEERGTASLEERLSAAEKIASKGNLVGFHFHPMIPYRGWEGDYGDVIDRLLTRFSPEQVSHVSFGTLTFIKPVIKAIRNRGLKTKVLQMPMVEIAGKYSYPFETKEHLFRTAYRCFAPWHDRVFFYMCMEDKELWKPVFGREYRTNEEFEEAMKGAYMEKIRRIIPG